MRTVREDAESIVDTLTEVRWDQKKSDDVDRLGPTSPSSSPLSWESSGPSPAARLR
ncbi:hypothetical protein [Actinomyces naeslundii]|uniref:hypothetical protein n=1 Tax=Actinomyces naeslundii TaxID=1655 RepID=UPI000A6243EA|nr:hypothetical protein [Actinomyces naeslundii]